MSPTLLAIPEAEIPGRYLIRAGNIDRIVQVTDYRTDQDGRPIALVGKVDANDLLLGDAPEDRTIIIPWHVVRYMEVLPAGD